MFFPSYFLITFRYLQSIKRDATISTMIKICFFGIFLGTFALALILSITKGFEQATYKKMQSIYPQCIIDAHGQELDYEKILPILHNPAYHVKHIAPEQSTQALCHNSSSANPCVIHLKGIDPTAEASVTALDAMILPKGQSHNLASILHDNQVLIGKQLALQLHVSTGSIITIMYTADEELNSNTTFLQTKVIVAGIFETGIEEFDAYLVYCNKDFFQTLFPYHGITQIYIALDAAYPEDEIIEKLAKTLHMNVYSWKKLYTSLVAALDLEKYAMFLILLLIILVASSHIISLLFMQITQKRKDIALLLAFGLPLASVKNIFLTLSMTICSIATLLGLITAYAVALFLQYYPWIKLPDNIYYTTHLPVIIEIPLFLFIFFVVLAISFFASLIPIKNIKTKHITTILRQET